jgi:hypothetical protein
MLLTASVMLLNDEKGYEVRRAKPTLLETRKPISKLLEIFDCGLVLFTLPSIGASTFGHCYT